jgi:hypothetical protein
VITDEDARKIPTGVRLSADPAGTKVVCFALLQCLRALQAAIDGREDFSRAWLPTGTDWSAAHQERIAWTRDLIEFIARRAKAGDFEAINAIDLAMRVDVFQTQPERRMTPIVERDHKRRAKARDAASKGGRAKAGKGAVRMSVEKELRKFKGPEKRRRSFVAQRVGCDPSYVSRVWNEMQTGR